MCKFQHKLLHKSEVKEPCLLIETLVTLGVIDDGERDSHFDEGGVCLFHSDDIDWKRSLGFQEKFMALFSGDPSRFFNEITLCSDSEKTALEFKNLNLHKSVTFRACTFFSRVEFVGCQIENGWLHLDYCIFSKAFKLCDCTIEAMSLMGVSTQDFSMSHVDISMGEAIFSRFICHKNFRLQNCHVAQSLDFDGAKFLDASYLFHDYGDNFFLTDTVVDDDILFDHTEIRGEAKFKNIQCRKFSFNQTEFSPSFPVSFEGIKIPEGGLLEFKGNTQRKIFNYATYFKLIDADNNGLIVFEYANLQYLTGDQKSHFLSLQKDKKVEIGKGCIKYRYQTPEKKFETASANIQLYEDIAGTFTNYFNATTGVSLGLEIVEKTPELIRFFYFTDEDITASELQTLFAITSDVLWNARNPQAATQIEGITASNQRNVDNLIDLVRLCLKMTARFDTGMLSNEDLLQIANVTSADEGLAINPGAIEGATALVLKVFVENLNVGTLNMHGSLLIAGDNAGTVNVELHP